MIRYFSAAAIRRSYNGDSVRERNGCKVGTEIKEDICLDRINTGSRRWIRPESDETFAVTKR